MEGCWAVWERVSKVTEPTELTVPTVSRMACCPVWTAVWDPVWSHPLYISLHHLTTSVLPAEAVLNFKRLYLSFETSSCSEIYDILKLQSQST